jgi:hypothetical protein
MIAFLISIVATTIMTLFSYGYSVLRQKKYKEPQLLNQLLQRAWIIRVSSNDPIGWAIHYVVGWLFIVLYLYILRTNDFHASLSFFVLCGIFSGFLGAAVWALVFRMHPNPPRIKLPEYLGMILVAHAAFGAGAYLGWELISSTQSYWRG